MDTPLVGKTLCVYCHTAHLLRPFILTLALFIAIPGLADERLAERAGCLQCHGITEKIVGPAYTDIAQRYATVPDAADTLQNKVKQGGKGNWVDVTGGIYMPPHSGVLNDAEISTLVDWILSRTEGGDE